MLMLAGCPRVTAQLLPEYGRVDETDLCMVWD